MTTGYGVGGNIYGGRLGGASAKIYGTGVLHGEQLIPEHELHAAAMAYKTLRGLHKHGERPHPIIPTDHAIQLMHEHLAHPKGGFLPPAVIAAALPFVSQAASSLLGGFFNQGGKHIADVIRGHGMHPTIGLPMRRRLGHQYHWHLHGEGFKDLLRAAFAKAKQVWHSEPVKRFGRNAFDTLTKALINVLTDKAQSYGERLFKGTPSPTVNSDMNEPSNENEEAAGTPPQDLAEPEAMAGSGLHRRKRRAAPRRPAMKRPRRAHHMMMLPSTY